MSGQNPETAAFEWEGGSVTAVRHYPAGAVAGTFLLAHGAGGNLHSPQIKALAEGLCERGVAVARFNFPYSEEGRKSPDRPATLEAVWRSVLEQAGERAPRLFAGGRSMGGRIASHVVARGAEVSGLIFLAYPLHPPGKPERLRDEHLYGITVPMLFVQGTRDTFAQPDLFDEVTAKLPTATVHRLEGGDHGFKVPGRRPPEVVAEICDVVATWISKQP